MASIFPSNASNGQVFRDIAGQPEDIENFVNVYVPDAAFTADCAFTAYPLDCVGSRFDTNQINGIVAEMLALGEAFDPNGNWACGEVNNLATLFAAFVTALPATLISTDTYNWLTLGTDGKLLVGGIEPPWSV